MGKTNQIGVVLEFLWERMHTLIKKKKPIMCPVTWPSNENLLVGLITKVLFFKKTCDWKYLRAPKHAGFLSKEIYVFDLMRPVFVGWL